MITGIVIQSCSTEDNYFVEPEKRAVINNFENLIKKMPLILKKSLKKKINF